MSLLSSRRETTLTVPKVCGKMFRIESIRCVKHVFRARLGRFIVWQHDGDGNEVVGASEGVEAVRAGA